MKFTTKDVTQGVNILANDHFVAIPYNCSEITATNGVIKAGTIIPSNDDKAIGVLLNDVYPAENPNGAIVIHGFIVAAKLPAAPTADTTIDSGTKIGAKTVLKQITFM